MRANLLVGIAMMLATTSLGQTTTPSTPKETKLTKKSELELALEEALKNNPDLRVAVAKAAEADAQLVRARAQVVQKVVAAYQVIDKAKATLAAAEATLARMQKLRSQTKGVVAEADYEAAVASVAQAKASLAAAQSELDYLTGKGKHAEKASRLYSKLDRDDAEKVIRVYGHLSDLVTEQAKGPAADRIRKALGKKGRFIIKDLTAREVLKSIQTEAERSGIHVQANTKGDAWDQKVTATFDDVPLSTVLQLLEDTLENHHVVIRDYGLLVVPRDKLPHGAVTMAAFLQSKPADPSAKNEDPIEGKVTRADGDLVTLSIGSDAGLVKGRELSVFRLGDKPRYLGKIKLVEVMAKTAVGQALKTDKMTGKIEVGDEVSTAPPIAK